MRDPQAEKPQGRAFDRVNRRRAGVLGRAIADAAAEAMEAAGVDPARVATIVGSSIGEATTMIGLLDQMWRYEEPMSPASFTVSVHNAASGLLSISSKNQGFATSLAADHDTPGVALLEAIGIVHQDRAPVLVVCADEAAPVTLVRSAPPWDLLASALVLSPLDGAPPDAPRLELLTDAPVTLPPRPLDPVLAENPQVGLFDLVDAVLCGTGGVLRLDRGRGRGYAARLTHGVR